MGRSFCKGREKKRKDEADLFFLAMQQYREKCIVKNVRGKNGNIPRESLKSPIFATCFDNSRSMMKYCWLFFVLIIMAASSCSVPKDVTYLQGLDSLTPEQKEMMNRSYESRICPDDQLSITVTASDPTVTTPFNPPVYSYAGAGEQATISSPAMYTYLVDADGYINFPVLGRLKVAGLTKQELAGMMQEKLKSYIEEPLVNIQITNFRVTVLGEVNRPTVFTVKSDRISILDALGFAGDVTINADRKNILLIRDNNGKKEYAHLDLTSAELLASPYFYLQQNDVVYVEPNDAKKRNSRYSQAQSFNVSLFSAALSAISIITSMVITIVNLKKN